jgi:photosystem II stability/assembly factor-like uncharacterized protein
MKSEVRSGSRRYRQSPKSAGRYEETSRETSHRLSIVLMVFACYANATGQSQWTSLNGPWEASGPCDIAVGYTASSSSVYTIGGPNGELLLSHDEGETWTPCVLEQVVAVACAERNPLSVYAARTSGSQWILSRSSNGGVAWTEERTFEQPVSRIVVSPHDARILYAGLGSPHVDVDRPLWRSADGGQTWQQVAGLGIYAHVTTIVFDPEDSSVIYVAATGTMGGVWKSRDGGGTWSPMITGMTAIQVSSLGIARLPHTRVLYAGTFEEGVGDQRIYTSSDAGEHWTVAVDGTGATNILTGPFPTSGVYAATKHGVLCTADGGATWLNKSTGIAGRNARMLGMVHQGSRGQLTHLLLGTVTAFYRSDDDGAHWSEKTTGMMLVPTYAVTANAAGIFTAAYGDRNSGAFISQSVDRRTWTTLLDNSVFGPSGGSPFYGFAVAGSPTDPNILLASGTIGEEYAQVVFRSSDAGTNWLKVSTHAYASQPCNIVFHPKDDRFVYTADLYHVLKSSDKGLTWGALPESPSGVFVICLAFGPGPTLETMYAGGSARVFRSQDHGKTWVAAQAGLPSAVVSLVCDPVDPQILYAGTNHHGVYWTTNGGSDWQPRNEGIYRDFVQSLTVDPATRLLYATAADYFGAPGRVYRSADLGATWIDITAGLPDIAVFNLSVDNSKGDTVALLGATPQGIFRFLDSRAGITKVGTPGDGAPQVFELEQNYPNPFNPSTKIEFRVASSGFASLKVYDVSGREVKTLVNEQLQPGSYNTTFDAGGLASGVYLCRLQAGSSVQTRKLVLLR